METESKQSEAETEQKEPSLIEVADRLEAANKEAREILAKQGALAARNLLGGSSDTGEQPQKEKELSDHEYRLKLEREIREGKYN